AGSHLGDLFTHLLGAKHRTRKRAKRSTNTRGDAQIDSARPGHGRLDDRVLAPDEVEEAAVGPAYHSPVFGIELQGSVGASAPPFCNSSIEILSGDRTKAMRPSLGGRLIATPLSISRWHV